jgi:major vault protein
MPNYEGYNTNEVTRQKDLVLATNEFCFLQNSTSGAIKTYTGPTVITISQQETLVYFDPNTKKFKETNDFARAKQLFISAPEGWYTILKNPAPDNSHPELGKASTGPELDIGRKINIRGPVSFSLFPGQMAKVVKGHALRSNQYLLARVYDADKADNADGKVVTVDGNEKKTNETNYITGQLLVIKGTEVSYYIPPTGIEVVPIDGGTEYVREAVTLERLEYCILKDEDGNKRYVHGPEVVFPRPTETFVTSPKGGYIFKAIELSKISGVYIKVIAEYTEGKTKHPIGEEMFITGNDQMIYYPRPEHAIINYDGKLIHHAIAIPEGEGRYIMNRLTGEIKTIKGPAMYLPDPRTEVVVKRKLSEKQCMLWFPGNTEALAYNEALNERAVAKAATKYMGTSLDAMNCAFTTNTTSNSTNSTLAYLEANANISRGTSYTKPRTITLDNKYDGVVSMDVWTGYAVNVISKNGDRKIVCGPQTILLDYDQTLEELQLSTGNPKTTDKLDHTVWLRYKNNKISDTVRVETKDFVKVDIKLSYCVDFDDQFKDKWFNIENYVKFLCDRQRSLMQREVKNYTIEEFYQNYSTIIRDVAINDNCDHGEGAMPHRGRVFTENGMCVIDAEVLDLKILDREIEAMVLHHQKEIVETNLDLSNAQKKMLVADKQLAAEKKLQEVNSQELLNKMELQRIEALKKHEIKAEINRRIEAEEITGKQAEKDLQAVLDAINDAKIARMEKEKQLNIDFKQKEAEIEAAKQKAYAETVKTIVDSIGPDLVAALQAQNNIDVMNGLGKAISPYAIAKGESVGDTITKVLRGTSLEETFKNVLSSVNKEN